MVVFEIFLSWYKIQNNYCYFCDYYEVHFDECGRTLILKGFNLKLLLPVFMKFKFILVAYIV